MNDWWSRRVVEFNFFQFSFWAEMKTSFQLRAEMESIPIAEMESIRSNEFARPKDAFMVPRAGQFTIQKPYKYTLVEPAEPVGMAHARIATRAIQLKWKSPAEMEFSFQHTAEMEFSFQPKAEMKIR